MVTVGDDEGDPTEFRLCAASHSKGLGKESLESGELWGGFNGPACELSVEMGLMSQRMNV